MSINPKQCKLVKKTVQTRKIFQRLQIALALRARAILSVFEEIYSCLFIPNRTRNHLITYTCLMIFAVTLCYLSSSEKRNFINLKKFEKLISRSKATQNRKKVFLSSNEA